MKRAVSPARSRSTSPDIKRLKRKLNYTSSTAQTKAAAATISKSINDNNNTISKSALDMKNHDLCDACGGVGQFLCCDACPNAFHFTCVEPPMDAADVANLKDHWFCTECEAKKNKLKKTKSNPRGLFHKLIEDINAKNPKSFRLPNDIVQFFKGVSSDKLGRYIDTTQVKQVRYKNGQVERPDYHQLKDKSGNYRKCYYCRMSALKKPMIACDYCTLYWHLDCLTPPLASAPNPAKKWRCPNHIEHIIKPPREQRKADDVIIINNDENKIPSSAYRHHLSHIIEKEHLPLKRDDETPPPPPRKAAHHHHHHQSSSSSITENIITSKEGVVYRLPVNPIQPADFTSYYKKMIKNNSNSNNSNSNNNSNIDRRRSSIPSTIASSSSSSEVNTPPLFRLSTPSQQEEKLQYDQTTTTTATPSTNNYNNEEEVEAWLQTMACFKAGGQAPMLSEEENSSSSSGDTHVLNLIRAATQFSPPTSPELPTPPPPPPQKQPHITTKKRTLDRPTFEKYQRIAQLLQQKDEQQLLKLLNTFP